MFTNHQTDSKAFSSKTRPQTPARLWRRSSSIWLVDDEDWSGKAWPSWHQTTFWCSLMLNRIPFRSGNQHLAATPMHILLLGKPSRLTQLYFTGDLFVPLMFVICNAGDVAGRIMAGLGPWSNRVPPMALLVSYALIRLPLAVLLLFCNVVTAQPWTLPNFIRWFSWWTPAMIQGQELSKSVCNLWSSWFHVFL